jgi:hypothetical protein
MSQTQSRSNPLVMVRSMVKKHGVPLSIKKQLLHFPVWKDERHSAACCFLRPSYSLYFRIAAPRYPMPRSTNYGDTLSFLELINTKLEAREGFHWKAEGRFTISPDKYRYPFYYAQLANAHRSTEAEVENFFGLMVAQFDEVLPLFVTAHENDCCPPPHYVYFALVQARPTRH